MAEAFFWGPGGQAISATDVASNRKVAAALKNRFQNPKTFWEGIQSAVGDIGGGLLEWEADETEKRGRQEFASSLAAAQESGNPNDYMTLIANSEFASPSQSAVANALLQRAWGKQDRDEQWAREDARANQPDWGFQALDNGDIITYDQNNPGAGYQTFYDGAPNPKDRTIKEDANGVPRYVDTGEAVFPDVAPVGDFGNEKDIAAQYTSQLPVKTFYAVRDGYGRVRASALLGEKNPADSGAADISMIFAYMKMLDPTSVVREGEFATAENAGGVGTQVSNLYNRLLKGGRLTSDLRKNFLDAADSLYAETAKNLETLNKQYLDRAKDWGVKPENFIVTPDTYPAFEAGGGAGEQPVEITSDEEYDALPSGALFVGPDGVARRKP